VNHDPLRLSQTELVLDEHGHPDVNNTARVLNQADLVINTAHLGDIDSSAQQASEESDPNKSDKQSLDDAVIISSPRQISDNS
jgi:hypothetical protein